MSEQQHPPVPPGCKDFTTALQLRNGSIYFLDIDCCDETVFFDAGHWQDIRFADKWTKRDCANAAIAGWVIIFIKHSRETGIAADKETDMGKRCDIFLKGTEEQRVFWVNVHAWLAWRDGNWKGGEEND